MNLSLKGFSQLIEDMSAALQSSASSLIDVSVGSVIRAIFEANASVALWLQWLIVQVLQTTRASTSTGVDLDSWMGDFGLARLPAVSATGIVTFSRFNSNLATNIPVGSIVKTSDGRVSFSVTEDNDLSIWQPSLAAYLLPIGVTSTDLPVICMVPGSIGNVLAQTITVIAASLPGIDQVNNMNLLSDGMDAETDPAFRLRFQEYLASRSRATLAAVRSGISSVQQGLNVLILENTGTAGSPQMGAFLVVVDDGTGFPAASLLSNVAMAVEAVRPIGTTFAVVAPAVLVVNVSLIAKLASNGSAANTISSIQNSVAYYLNTLPIGKCASVTRIAQCAYLAAAQAENITAIQLNGSENDVLPPAQTVVKAGEIVVMTNDG